MEVSNVLLYEFSCNKFPCNISKIGGKRMEFRKALEEDVGAIVQLLADDELGSKRECFTDPLPTVYYDAFQAMEAQSDNEIILAVDGNNILGRSEERRVGK